MTVKWFHRPGHTTTDDTREFAQVSLAGYRFDYKSVYCLVADQNGHINNHGSEYVRIHVPVMLDLMTGRPVAAHGTHGDGLPADEN